MSRRRKMLSVEGAWNAAAKRRALRDVKATLAVGAEDTPEQQRALYMASWWLCWRMFKAEAIRA